MIPDTYISSGILELYVAGVLSPAEAKEVENYAKAHTSISDEIKRIEATFGKYAAVYPPPLSAEVFDKISARLDEAPPVVAEPKKETKANPPQPKTVKMQQRDEPVVRREKRSGGYGWLVAASLILFFLSAFLNMYLYQQWQAAQNEVAELQNDNTEMAQQFKQANLEKEQAFSQMGIYTDPNYKKVNMKGLPIAAQSAAIVYWNSQTHDVFVQVKDLPAAPEGKQYQLWAIDEEDKPVNAGMLTSTDSKEMSPMNKVSNAKAFAITLEPAGGSQNPTMDAMYVMGNI